mmetsp:Transcript_27315/g.59683  ORF Transcript_27315/g.59683 Transcript_27315/m.59683 type:complete len:270 (-) Transcript_27315:810-1619(-)
MLVVAPGTSCSPRAKERGAVSESRRLSSFPRVRTSHMELRRRKTTSGSAGSLAWPACLILRVPLVESSRLGTSPLGSFLNSRPVLDSSNFGMTRLVVSMSPLSDFVAGREGWPWYDAMKPILEASAPCGPPRRDFGFSPLCAGEELLCPDRALCADRALLCADRARPCTDRVSFGAPEGSIPWTDPIPSILGSNPWLKSVCVICIAGCCKVALEENALSLRSTEDTFKSLSLSSTEIVPDVRHPARCWLDIVSKQACMMRRCSSRLSAL